MAPRAPEVREPLDAAAALLSARALAVFLVDRPGALIALENTRPPALIVPAGFAALPLGARRFLATRAVDLLERGGALVGKFAPRDVGILLELACRFAGGKPAVAGAPRRHGPAPSSRPWPAAVPPVLAARVASLGHACVRGAGLHRGSESVAASLRRTSARVALLATGDPAGAFAALLAAEPPARPTSSAEALRLPSAAGAGDAGPLRALPRPPGGGGRLTPAVRRPAPALLLLPLLAAGCNAGGGGLPLPRQPGGHPGLQRDPDAGELRRRRPRRGGQRALPATVDFTGTVTSFSSGTAAALCVARPNAEPLTGTGAADAIDVSLETRGALLERLQRPLRRHRPPAGGRDPAARSRRRPLRLHRDAGRRGRRQDPTVAGADCAPCTTPCRATYALSALPTGTR